MEQLLQRYIRGKVSEEERLKVVSLKEVKQQADKEDVIIICGTYHFRMN